MNKLAIFLLFSVFAASGQTKDPAFGHMLKLKLEHHVPEIGPKELQVDQFYFLDCRELSEYQVSHIPNAIFVGPKPENKTIMDLPRDKPWVFYCSVGVRSEQVTELALNHHPESYNLVGGIFEWVNQGKPLEDASGQTTNKVHPYNRVWGVWLRAGNKSFE